MPQMVMVGFLQAQNCTDLVSSWRHPESRDDSMSADYYRTIGRDGNDDRHAVKHGTTLRENLGLQIPRATWSNTR